MTIFRVVLFSSFMLIGTVQALTRSRSMSYPMTRRQVNEVAKTRRCMRGQWLKKRRGSFGVTYSLMEKAGLAEHPGSTRESRKTQLTMLALRSFIASRKKVASS